ncbi:f-box-like domain-containing protein [Phthorimaea operculella]|nr:f-box-like domain-containing protein [Phthorimaea operculella]
MELPYEILVYLFEHLPKSDRKAASEVCRSWYLAANDQYFLKNKTVLFFKTPLNEEATSPLKIFENSEVIYYNYVFNEVEISNKVNYFWDIIDALFNRFVMAAPALEELNLSGCSLQFHVGLVKKFYPQDTDVFQNPSESVLTFYFVLQFLVKRAKNIKRLLFSNTLIDGVALKNLAEAEDLKLDSLKVHACDQLTNTGFLALTTHQTSLKVLDIGLCTRVTDQTLVYIAKNLVNLEHLNIQRCRAVTDLGVAEVQKLKKLKYLNISECELITKEGLKKGICAQVNQVMEELDIHSLNIDQDCLVMISDSLPNLRYLNISYCFNAVTDTSIQVIFKNQVNLRVLLMSHCDKVSDAGLTGMGKVDAEGGDDGPIMSTHDEIDAHPRIHLGSRAEEEIVRDARRKRDVMRMCEKLTMDNFTGYSLARLKSLQHLDITYCNRITDVSFIYAFNFKELVNLNLSKCQQITCEGIEHLVKNCSSIEYLNLIDCYNLNDDAIKEIAKGLKRLQRLELRGCNQLTDKSLEHIRSHCKKLKYLDVQGCRSMSPELASSLGCLPTLHTILMSKPKFEPETPITARNIHKSNHLFGLLRLH